MIRALCWKEYREQRAIWLAVAAITVLVVYGLGAALAPGGLATLRQHEELCDRLALVVLGMAVVYGLVCGALLLAGEREVGTLRFLDALAARRAPLWKTKVLIGLALTLGQVVALTTVAVLAGLMPPGSAPRWGAWVLVLALNAYAWGLLGSSLCRRVFAGAVLGAALFGISWAFPRLLAWRMPALAVWPITMAVIAVTASGLIFCRLDRRRTGQRSLRQPGVARPASVRVLLWLTVRERKLELLVLLGACLLAPLDPFSWHFLPCLGLVCGTAVFAGEQEGGREFLAVQRLPPGRVWAVRITCWGSLVILLMVGIVLGARLHRPLREMLRLGPLPDFGLDWFMAFLVLYGFSAGQLAMLLLRRRLLALLTAALGGASLMAMWLPSLVLGGLPVWLLLGPPLLLILAGRVAMWPWLADNLRARKSIAALFGCGLLVATWFVGGLWYRVVSIPDIDEPFDRSAFEAGLDAAEKSPAGRLLQQGCDKLETLEARVCTRLGIPLQPLFVKQPGEIQEPPAPNEPMLPSEGRRSLSALETSAVALVGTASAQGLLGALPVLVAHKVETQPQQASKAYREQLVQVIENGWPREATELGHWLDELFAGQWASDLREAGRAPLGLVVDPRTARAWKRLAYKPAAAAELFVGRALQLQAQGNDAAALDEIATVLALSRQLRNKTPLSPLLAALYMDKLALDGLDRWLARAKPQQQLLRRALDLLRRHDEQTPAVVDNLKAESYLLPQYLDELRRSWRNASLEGLASLALQVPWEMARARRLLKVRFDEEWRRAALPTWEQIARLPRTRHNRPGLRRPWQELEHYWHIVNEAIVLDLTRRRGERLRIALALYGVAEGKPAARVEDVVPRYLANLPLDPYTGRPFGYRVSHGESILTFTDELKAWPPRIVAAGQGVVWSTGPDQKDYGGVYAGPTYQLEPAKWWENNAADIVFLVPTWPKQ